MSRQGYTVSFFIFAYGLIIIATAAVVAATIFIAADISILMAILLWLMYFVDRRLQWTIKRNILRLGFLLMPVAAALVYWVLPIWLAYVLIGSWLGLATIIIVLARRNLYWSWFFSDRNYSLYLYAWFEKAMTYAEWAAMLKRWQKRNEYMHIQDFVSSYFTIYVENIDKKDPEMSRKMQALLPLAHEYCRAPYLLSDIDMVMSFNILCHDELLFFFLAQAQKQPIYLDNFANICDFANQQIDAYVENPDYYPFLTTYFLQPNLLDKVERWQEVEILKLADTPNVQEKLHYFFGLHYMAIGIARNMPTSETETSESEASEGETSS